MVRVGVDAWNIPGDRRGIGRYVREILRAWSDPDIAERVDVTLVVPEWHTWTVSGRYVRELEGRPYRVVSRALHARAPLDVLWFPFNGCSWTNFTLPAVATLHDASNFVLPDTMPEMQRLFHAAAERCRFLITDSVFSQHELARELHVSEERFTPILLGVTPPEPPRGASLDVEALRPYVLFVGTSDRRKGLDVLCGAMEIVQGERPDLRLILAGERSDHVPGLERLHGDALGYVDDTTLAELYRNAAVFAFPSRYEGFGLPVLEAMKYGTPVVTSNAASIPEAAGDAGLYVPVDDARALAAAIIKVVSEPNVASDLRERGVRRATEMTWQKTAEATLDVLERAAAR